MYLLSSKPRVLSADQILLTTWDFITGLPLGWQIRGRQLRLSLRSRLGGLPLGIYRSLPDNPKYLLTPFLNWSVMDCLRWISVVDGLSIATLLKSSVAVVL